jgi:hypothetical protein
LKKGIFSNKEKDGIAIISETGMNINPVVLLSSFRIPKIKFGGEMVALKTCVLMKVGSHGNESFSEIIDRKKKEQKAAGFMLWGYSGNLLNAKLVADYLQSRWKLGERLLLLMIETNSPFKNNPVRSIAFSIDSHSWYNLPNGVATSGCDKAIVCSNLTKVDSYFNLSLYKVAVGPSSGKNLSSYLKNRTDKACAMFSYSLEEIETHEVVISWAAEIVPPFAVYLTDRSNVQTSLFTPSTDKSLGVLAKN